MIKKLRSNKGFTLIELMIAMSIFVIFTGIMINSYTSVVRGQRDANEYRMLYAEARYVFDKLTDEVRNGVIYYPEEGIIGLNDELRLVSNDGEEFKVFSHEDLDGRLTFCEKKDGIAKGYDLNSEVKVTSFVVDIHPNEDPYRIENVNYDSMQFHPKVHLEAVFEKEDTKGEMYELKLETVVSSRFYGAAPSVDDPTCFIIND